MIEIRNHIFLGTPRFFVVHKFSNTIFSVPQFSNHFSNDLFTAQMWRGKIAYLHTKNKKYGQVCTSRHRVAMSHLLSYLPSWHATKRWWLEKQRVKQQRLRCVALHAGVFGPTLGRGRPLRTHLACARPKLLGLCRGRPLPAPANVRTPRTPTQGRRNC